MSDKHDADDKKRCRPCEPFKPWRPKAIPQTPSPKPCPETVEELCQEVKANFRRWQVWGAGVNDTLELFASYIYRLEHAVCCLEGHVIYGHARPDEGLICDEDGEFRKGTLHDLVTQPWPITDPPPDPWD